MTRTYSTKILPRNAKEGEGFKVLAWAGWVSGIRSNALVTLVLRCCSISALLLNKLESYMPNVCLQKTNGHLLAIVN